MGKWCAGEGGRRGRKGKGEAERRGGKGMGAGGEGGKVDGEEEDLFFVSNMPHHGKVNFERDAKWSVLRPTVCDSLRVSRADN